MERAQIRINTKCAGAARHFFARGNLVWPWFVQGTDRAEAGFGTWRSAATYPAGWLNAFHDLVYQLAIRESRATDQRARPQLCRHAELSRANGLPTSS